MARRTSTCRLYRAELGTELGLLLDPGFLVLVDLLACRYDARVAESIKGWGSPGFNDATWSKAELVSGPGGVLRSPMMPSIRPTTTLVPKSVTEPQPGVFVFDFGQVGSVVVAGVN